MNVLGTRYDVRLHLGRVPALRPLSTWAERTQQDACRNAMVASTLLAEHRRERDEVAAYVETLIAHRAGTATAPTGARAAVLG